MTPQRGSPKNPRVRVPFNERFDSILSDIFAVYGNHYFITVGKVIDILPCVIIVTSRHREVSQTYSRVAAAYFSRKYGM